MNFRTTFNIVPFSSKIDYNTPVMFIGSCFASEMGEKMKEGRMNVLINPYGTVFNPVSVGKTLESVIENRKFTKSDLFNYKGEYISFYHYTDFSSHEINVALEKINSGNEEAHSFLKKAACLFVTFGTARVYRFKESNEIVSNCHKLPDSFFLQEILTVEEITAYWTDLLKKLFSFNPELKIIFTISPVRHWKDGAHGNQVSKSVLFLSIENLLTTTKSYSYFPAYELLMDDLRDYRYYASDMLHPSETAVDYIWKAFSDCYFVKDTESLRKEIRNITMALHHRFLSDSEEGKKTFAENMLKKISLIEKELPSVDLSKEKSYFMDLNL
jgi:hypothetical protein